MSKPDHSPSAAGTGGEAAASVELLYRRHHAWLLRYVRLRFGALDAEDIVQETYLKAGAYQGVRIASPRGLLIQIARRVVIDRSRRAAVRPVLAEALDRHMATPCAQAEALALKQVVLALRPRVREVFILSRFGGLTYEDIADRLGVAVKTVEGRMTEALRACAEALRR